MKRWKSARVRTTRTSVEVMDSPRNARNTLRPEGLRHRRPPAILQRAPSTFVSFVALSALKAPLRYRSAVRPPETIAIVYFLYLAAAAALKPLPVARRALVAATSLSMVAVTWDAAVNAPLVLRDWLPAAYILAAYYMTGWLFVAPSPR